MNVTFRPIERWPKPGFEPNRIRERSRFDSSWSRILDLLTYEVGRLNADAVVVRLDLEDRDIRRDGWPRSNARPGHPGVVIEWQIGDAWYGRAAEKYDDWHDNIYAIARTLNAFRDVERWGVVSGEQYEGMRLEIEGPGRWDGAVEARIVLERHAELREEEQGTLDIATVYRRARRWAHPDAGGSEDAFNEVQEAWRVLGGGS